MTGTLFFALISIPRWINPFVAKDTDHEEYQRAKILIYQHLTTSYRYIYGNIVFNYKVLVPPS